MERIGIQGAIAGLTPEEIAKAEELANWRFIEEEGEAHDFRDHLARFPQGTTARMARSRLERAVWRDTPLAEEELKAFLAEFPDGEYAKRHEIA